MVARHTLSSRDLQSLPLWFLAPNVPKSASGQPAAYSKPRYLSPSQAALTFDAHSTEMNSSRTPPTPPVSILFVCLGNICRSTMAEGVFQHHLSRIPADQRALIKSIDSAGTGAYHAGAAPDSRTTAVLKSRGINDYKHSARRVRESDFQDFDLLLGMDAANVEDLQDLKSRLVKQGRLDANSSKGQVMLFGSPELGGRHKRGEEIDDPYYGGSEGFEMAFEQVLRLSKGLLAWVEKGAD